MSVSERVRRLTGRIRPNPYNPEIVQMRERGVVNIIVGMYTNERLLTAEGAHLIAARAVENSSRALATFFESVDVDPAAVDALKESNAQELREALKNPYQEEYKARVDKALSTLLKDRRGRIREEALKAAKDRIVNRLSAEEVSDEYQAGAGRALMEIDHQLRELADNKI